MSTLDNPTRPLANGNAAPHSTLGPQRPSKGGANANPNFIKSATFKGVKPGYVFKKGHNGMGYYKEGKQKNVDAEREAAVNGTSSREIERVLQGSGAQQLQKGDDSGSDGEGDRNGDEQGDFMKALPAGGLSQRELIRMAFAGDDVEEDFALEKVEILRDKHLVKEEGWGYTHCIAKCTAPHVLCQMRAALHQTDT